MLQRGFTGWIIDSPDRWSRDQRPQHFAYEGNADQKSFFEQYLGADWPDMLANSTEERTGRASQYRELLGLGHKFGYGGTCRIEIVFPNKPDRSAIPRWMRQKQRPFDPVMSQRITTYRARMKEYDEDNHHVANDHDEEWVGWRLLDEDPLCNVCDDDP